MRDGTCNPLSCLRPPLKYERHIVTYTHWMTSSQRLGLPLLASILHKTTSVKCRLIARPQINHCLSWWLSFHLTPWGINKAASVAIRNDCSFRQHCNPRLWGEKWTSNKILYPQQDTMHIILFDCHPIYVYQEQLARRHWPTQVLLNGRSKTRFKWTNCNNKVISYMIGDKTCFIQMLSNTETRLWRAESQDAAHVRAASCWNLLQLPLLLPKWLVFSFAGLYLSTVHLSFLQKSLKPNSCRVVSSFPTINRGE